MRNYLIIFFSILLFSCKEDEETVLEEINTDCVTLNLNDENCKISQIKVHYSYNPMDTLILSYTYRGDNLDKTILSLIGYSSNLDSSVYLHNSSDQLYAVLKTNSVTNELDTFEHYYFNPYNQLTEASFYSNDGKLLSAVTMTYSNCKLTELFVEYQTIATSERYNFTTGDSDNIINYKLTERDGQPAAPADSSFLIEFDDKINPYRYYPSRYFPDRYFPTRYLSIQNFQPFLYFSKNNMTRYRVLKDNITQLERSIQYTYNQELLPIKAVKTEGSTTTTTWFYYNCN